MMRPPSMVPLDENDTRRYLPKLRIAVSLCERHLGKEAMSALRVAKETNREELLL